MDSREPAPIVFRRVLANLADTIVANRAGTIEDLDPEHLHDLRVAVRRTRSVLAEAKGVLPEDVRRSYRERFGWLGQRTGPPRDLDVHVLGWDEHVGPLDNVDASSLERVRRELEARRVAAHVELATVLRGADYHDLVDGWRRWLADPGPGTAGGEATGPVVARRVERAHERLVRDGRRISPESEPARFHDLRKDAKKLRYLLECFAPVFPRRRRKDFVGQLKDLQDNLGAHQDAEVQLLQLRELADDLQARSIVDSEALGAMSRLSDQLERRRVVERADFAGRFARYDREANHKVLAKLVRAAARPRRSRPS
jgi:CHAD domain-containing protein